MRKKSIIALTTALMSICLYTQPIQTYIANAADTKTTIVSELPETDEISALAVSKLNALSDLFALYIGAPAFTETTTDTTTDGLLLKVTDKRFTSIEDVKNFINSTCRVALKSSLIENINEFFVEKDGALYVKRRLTSYITIPTSKGVTLTRVKPDEFIVITEDYTEMDGYTKAVFHKYDGDWYIESIEFLEGNVRLEHFALNRMEELDTLIDFFHSGFEYSNEEAVTINDIQYKKSTYVGIKTMSDLKNIITRASTGILYDQLMASVSDYCTEKDGALYIRKSEPSEHRFDFYHGIKLTDITDDGFTATTEDSIDDDNRRGQIILKRTSHDNWQVSSYEFIDFSSDINSIAIERMDMLSKFIRILAGAPGYVESEDFIMVNETKYVRLKNVPFSDYNTFKGLVNYFAEDPLNESLITDAGKSIIIENEKLYVESKAVSFPIFRTEQGVEITDMTETSCTATTIADDDLYGKGTAYLKLIDGHWYISDYEFGNGDQHYDYQLGDINGDTKIDAKDASVVLVEYSKMSTGEDSSLSDSQKLLADVNNDGKIDAKDSSVILAYYSVASTATGEVPTLQEFVASQGS